MSTLSANTLFHFTRTRETLINILKTRFYPRLSLEENFFVKWGIKLHIQWYVFAIYLYHK